MNKLVVAAVFVGALFAGGWWAFIDGAVVAPDAFPWMHIVPALLSSVAVIMLNLVDPADDGDNQVLVRVWIFIWFTVACCAVGGAIWITTTEYPPNINDNWPGVSIIVQTILVFLAGLVLFVARLRLDGGGKF